MSERSLLLDGFDVRFLFRKRRQPYSCPKKMMRRISLNNIKFVIKKYVGN